MTAHDKLIQMKERIKFLERELWFYADPENWITKMKVKDKSIILDLVLILNGYVANTIDTQIIGMALKKVILAIKASGLAATKE